MSLGAAFRNFINPLFGLTERDDDVGYEPTPLRAMRVITNAESFSAILPYCAYHATEGLFVLDTGERKPKGISPSR